MRCTGATAWAGNPSPVMGATCSVLDMPRADAYYFTHRMTVKELQMSTDTAHDTAFFLQGQDAIRRATDAWSRSVTAAVRQAPHFAPQDVEAAVDRFFDLNARFLDAQRQFTKRVVASLSEAGVVAAEKADAARNARGWAQ